MSLNLKNRITVFLRAREKTFKDLAEYIEMTEIELEQGISERSLDVKTLEQISKALRIPLYSFFRFPGVTIPTEVIRYYNMKLPDNEDDIDTDIDKQALKKEIELLKIQLQDREEKLNLLNDKDEF